MINHMFAKQIPNSFETVWGTDSETIIGLTRNEIIAIDGSKQFAHSFLIPTQSESFSPVGDYSPKLDIFVAVLAPGIVTAIQISTRRQLWQINDKRLVTSVCILDVSEDVVLSGRSTKVVKLKDGSHVDSPISNYHSLIEAGSGCICTKNKTQEVYWFSHSLKPGLILHSPLPSLKTALYTPHFFAVLGFDNPSEILFLDPVFGNLINRVNVRNCDLVDAIAYDSEGDCLLVVSHSVFKRIEVWGIAADGKKDQIAVLPEGIGRTGWSFCLRRNQLVSPSGRLADLSTGKLLRNSWEDWNLTLQNP